MNKELVREIIACLRVPADEQVPPRRLSQFGAKEWRGILLWLDFSGLSLYLLQHIRDSGDESAVPRFVLERLTRNLEGNRRRVHEMAEEFRLLKETFVQAGIEYAVLKGFSLVPDYCPDASLRTQYDYDILIRPSALQCAQRALRTAGYLLKTSDPHSPHVYFRSDRRPRRPSAWEDLYSARLQRTTELHVTLWDENEDLIALEPPEKVMDRTYLRSWNGLTFAALADEDAILFQGLHAFHHILHNWCRLAVFLEVAHFLNEKSADSDFWARAQARTEHCIKVRQALGVVFSLAMEMFGAQVPAVVEPWTTRTLTPAMGLWVRQYGVKSALGNFIVNKFSLFLHREFVRDKQSWRQIRRRRLLPLHPPHRWAEATSPQLEARLSARCKQCGYIIKRIGFHALAALRYAWEYPRWKRACRHALTHQVAAAKSRAPASVVCISGDVPR